MAQATEGVVGSGGLGLSNSGKGMMALKRVISVILDDSHEYFAGFQSLGTIFYEDPYDSFNSLEGELKLNTNNSARPITPNQQFYPLIGELVFLINTMSNEPSGGDKQFNYRNYYFPPIRVHNQSSQNSQPAKFTTEETTQTEKKDRAQSGTPNKASESSGAIINLGDFFEDRGVKRLLPYEGDYIIEGRFGNLIRFGATTPYNEETETPYPNPWSFNSVGGKSTPNETEAQIGDPITIIRNGQTEVVSDNALVPLLEDINGDHSSIYLCSNQRLENLKVAGASTASPDTVKQEAYIIKEEDTIDNPLTATTYKLTAGIFDTSETAVTSTPFSLTPTSPPPPPPPPTPTITVTSSIQDATDDGLSFFDEMVGSGAVEADNFITEHFTYESEETTETVTYSSEDNPTIEYSPRDVDVDEFIGKYFQLKHLIASNTARRDNINNIPGADGLIESQLVIDNLKALMENVGDKIFDQYPTMRISSGFRCEKLNIAISGSTTTEHSYGKAIDFQVPSTKTSVIFNWIVSNIPAWGQLIWEFPEQESSSGGSGSWIHVSYRRGSGANPNKTTLASNKSSIHDAYGGTVRGTHQNGIGTAIQSYV